MYAIKQNFLFFCLATINGDPIGYTEGSVVRKDGVFIGGVTTLPQDSNSEWIPENILPYVLAELHKQGVVAVISKVVSNHEEIAFPPIGVEWLF